TSRTTRRLHEQHDGQQHGGDQPAGGRNQPPQGTPMDARVDAHRWPMLVTTRVVTGGSHRGLCQFYVRLKAGERNSVPGEGGAGRAVRPRAGLAMWTPVRDPVVVALGGAADRGAA